MKSNPSTGSAAELADESADDKGREIVLKNHKLLRRLYLQERLEVNEDVCAICDFNREILYYGSYDRNRNVECFNVCELCGKDLITKSAALEAHSDGSALAALKEWNEKMLSYMPYPVGDFTRGQKNAFLLMQTKLKALEAEATGTQTQEGA